MKEKKSLIDSEDHDSASNTSEKQINWLSRFFQLKDRIFASANDTSVFRNEKSKMKARGSMVIF